MCDEGRSATTYVNSSERITAAAACSRDGAASTRAVDAGRCRDCAANFAEAGERDAGGVVAVLSPFLTCEEAYLLAKYFKGLSQRRAARARPGAGGRRGRHLPEGRRGTAGRADEVHDPRREVPEPPRRRGGAEALPGRGGALRRHAMRAAGEVQAL